MIYLLTYDHSHRKTQDLLYHFKLADVDLRVLILPWVDRKNFVPLFRVKPEPYLYGPELLCKKLGFKFDKVELSDVVDVPGSTDFCPIKNGIVVIGGAGILKRSFVETNTVINAHNGYLPKVRGLDVLKWAIYHGHPIGVSTHIVDEECDAGALIERREVPLYPQDSLYSIAIRQYEQEISMLVDAVKVEKYLNTVPFNEPAHEPHRRMKHSTELVMMERLKERLRELSVET